jgi:hypothetical protein
MSCTSASTFARYCAFVSDQGVTRPGPASSLKTTTGVAHPVCADANVYSRCARSGIVAGSVGFVVVPTRFFRFRSKYTVAAPSERMCAGQSPVDAPSAMPGCP